MQRRQLILSLSSLAAISAVKAKEAPKGKILIVYYSRKGENWWDGTTRVLQTGNTARMARVIQRTIGGDLYEIETVKPYPADYRETTKVARDELAKEARPAIKKPLPDFSAYRAVLIGHPIWWGKMPRAVMNFIEQADLAGKKVVMFATHGGSGLGPSPGHQLPRGLLCAARLLTGQRMKLSAGPGLSGSEVGRRHECSYRSYRGLSLQSLFRTEHPGYEGTPELLA